MNRGNNSATMLGQLIQKLNNVQGGGRVQTCCRLIKEKY